MQQLELDLFLPTWRVHFVDSDGTTGAYDVEVLNVNEANYAVKQVHPQAVRIFGYIPGSKEERVLKRAFSHTTSPSAA